MLETKLVTQQYEEKCLSQLESVPYFLVRKIKGGVQTRGQHACFLGHKISHTPGQKDDGIYAQWTWDGNKLTVRNDRYGFYPLYYSYYNGTLCISPSIIRLLDQGAPGSFDYAALSVFFRLGFFIGEDSPFEFIKALPPRVCFSWVDGKLHISGQSHYGMQRGSLTYDQAVDAYIDLFRQSIKRRLPSDENFIVPLSGGRDSRHILFQLCALGYKPKFCLTSQLFPPQSNEDIKIARLISEQLKIKHVVLNQTDRLFQVELKRNLATNFCSDELQESLKVTDFLKNKTTTMYDGIGGDVLSQSVFLKKDKLDIYRKKRFNELAEKIIDGMATRCMPEVVLKKLFHQDVRKALTRSRAVNRLSDEFKKHADAPNPVGQFYFWNRTRREVALSPYSISRSIPLVYSPYLDQDLYDFLSSLDAEIILGHSFHSDVIKRAFPEYSYIPYENKKALQDPKEFRARFIYDFLRYLIASLGSICKLVRAWYLIPRMVSHLVGRNHWWVCPPLILYWLQLNKIVLCRKTVKTGRGR